MKKVWSAALVPHGAVLVEVGACSYSKLGRGYLRDDKLILRDEDAAALEKVAQEYGVLITTKVVDGFGPVEPRVVRGHGLVLAAVVAAIADLYDVRPPNGLYWGRVAGGYTHAVPSYTVGRLAADERLALVMPVHSACCWGAEYVDYLDIHGIVGMDGLRHYIQSTKFVEPEYLIDDGKPYYTMKQFNALPIEVRRAFLVAAAGAHHVGLVGRSTGGIADAAIGLAALLPEVDGLALDVVMAAREYAERDPIDVPVAPRMAFIDSDDDAEPSALRRAAGGLTVVTDAAYVSPRRLAELASDPMRALTQFLVGTCGPRDENHVNRMQRVRRCEPLWSLCDIRIGMDRPDGGACILDELLEDPHSAVCQARDLQSTMLNRWECIGHGPGARRQRLARSIANLLGRDRPNRTDLQLAARFGF